MVYKKRNNSVGVIDFTLDILIALLFDINYKKSDILLGVFVFISLIRLTNVLLSNSYLTRKMKNIDLIIVILRVGISIITVMEQSID